MDKYEYKLRSEEILKLIEEEKYVEAAKIADMIDWRRVKSISMLVRVAALYRVNRRNEDSRAVLQLAYDRYPTNRSVVYSLCEVSIELDDVVAAIEYYKEFVKLAPRDNGVYTLRYRILEAQEANLEERISVLEELKKRDYQEEWAYELAYLYHRVGLGTKCVEECDDLILWFGDGPYVTKAMELKMLHAPLTPIQQKKYDMAQRQLQGEAVEEQPYYEDENQESDGTNETYADDTYPQEGYTEENTYADEQQEYTDDSQYVYADDENNEYTYYEGYEGNQYTDEPEQEQSYVGSAYTEEDTYAGEGVSYAEENSVEEEVVQKQNTGSLDMSQYNTINLQKVVAESMRELFPDDEDIFSQEWTEVSDEDTVTIEAQENDEPEMDVSEDFTRDEAVPVPVPARNINTGRIAEMVTGVSEVAPEPNTGAISKVFLPGNDAYDVRQHTDMEEVRAVTEELVKEEQDRIEENQENVYAEQSIAISDEVQPEEQPEFTPMTGQMNLDEVLGEWERMKKEMEEKQKEEVKQKVLRQTGKIFQNFDEAVKTGILAELGDEETPVRTETFLEDDETEEAISPLEEAVAKELGGRTKDIPQEELEESLQSVDQEEAEAFSEEEEIEELQEIEVTDSEAVEEEYLADDTEIDESCADQEEDIVAEEEQYEDDCYLESEESEEYAEVEDVLEEENENGEIFAESEEPDVLKTQEISMNTEEISSLPDKIIEATKKETKAAKREEIREFTPEEKELFENFSVTKKIRKQIIYALDNMSLAAYTGNVLITGEPGLGTVRLAKNLIREYQAMDANFLGKVAKITGEKLNHRDLKEVFNKLKNGAIIIEKANGLSEETLYQLAGLLNQEELGIIVIMEDTRKEITKLLEKQAMIADYFNIRIDLMEMDNNALVAYAKNYAQALEYSIDELGTLALYTRIANSQSGNHVVTKDEVREIVDEAIYKSRKFKIKNFVDVLFSKRYDSEDMIVLKERDFI